MVGTGPLLGSKPGPASSSARHKVPGSERTNIRDGDDVYKSGSSNSLYETYRDLRSSQCLHHVIQGGWRVQLEANVPTVADAMDRTSSGAISISIPVEPPPTAIVENPSNVASMTTFTVCGTPIGDTPLRG